MTIRISADCDSRLEKYKSPIRQVAALCTRNRDGKGEVLLITSSHGRWILPKGWPMTGKSDAEAAKIEAWEEAGVIASRVSQNPVARIETVKHVSDEDTTPCLLDVYLCEVDQLKSEFPEQHKRERKWVTFDQAAELVSDPELKELVASL